MNPFDAINTTDILVLDGASCFGHDPAWWDTDMPAGNHEAIDICRTCPVRTRCLEAAITNNEPTGIWGGTTPTQRQQLGGAAA